MSDTNSKKIRNVIRWVLFAPSVIGAWFIAYANVGTIILFAIDKFNLMTVMPFAFISAEYVAAWLANFVAVLVAPTKKGKTRSVMFWVSCILLALRGFSGYIELYMRGINKAPYTTILFATALLAMYAARRGGHSSLRKFG